MATRGGVVWLTGPSSAGKSVVAELVANGLQRPYATSIVLEGIETNLYQPNATRADRDAYAHYYAKAARVLANQGVLVHVPMISPYRATREEIRRLSLADGHDFIEVYFTADVAALEERDVHGWYAYVRRGLLANLPGFGGVYEPPESAALAFHTDQIGHGEAIARLMQLLDSRGF